MILSYPLLGRMKEFFCLCDDLPGFRFSSHIGIVIIDDVSLAPASLKVIAVGGRGLAHGELNALKGNLVMSGASRHSVTGAGNCHLRSL